MTLSLSWWWQVWGIGIIELAVFVGIGIFVFVKLRNATPATKYQQNNNNNKSSGINQISNHKKMRNNSKIVRKHIGQDSYRNRNKDTEYNNGNDIFPIPHDQNTISRAKGSVNQNRGEPRIILRKNI